VVFSYSAPTSVTNIDDGQDGQEVRLINRSVNAITFTRANARLRGSVNQVLPIHGTLVIVNQAGEWVQTSVETTNG
jgi:hypothetical protein